MTIGDEITYTDSRGRTVSGVVINTMGAKLVDVDTGETYEGRKFYVWDSKRERGEWTLAMRSPAVPGDRRHP